DLESAGRTIDEVWIHPQDRDVFDAAFDGHWEGDTELWGARIIFSEKQEERRFTLKCFKPYETLSQHPFPEA
ncbi:MAG: hypothetical protein AAGM67_08500, partial [Bacteroidota bacterium]